jgi:hypothetical protein
MYIDCTRGMTDAALISFTASCQRLKIVFNACPRDVLGRVATHPGHALDRLLPAN